MGSLYRPKYRDRHGQERQSSIWWIKYYSRGRMIREGTETTDYELAKDFLKKREGEAVDKSPAHVISRRITFAESAQDELDDYVINGRGTIKDLQTRLEIHILPFFGKSRAIDIKTN